MIEELTTQETHACYGGVRMVEKESTGEGGRAMVVTIAATFGSLLLFVYWQPDTIFKQIVAVSLISALSIAGYRSVAGTKYMVDLDKEYTYE